MNRNTEKLNGRYLGASTVPSGLPILLRFELICSGAPGETGSLGCRNTLG